jgi:predicted ATPase/DNA-binding SARP family transcriptional activator
MSRPVFFLLGHPRIECDGMPVKLRRRKAFALLTYLVVTGKRYSRDYLATLFWPGNDQSKARAGLRRVLSSIKNALGENLLRVDRESVELAPDIEIWLDTVEFQGQLAECRTHDHPPDSICDDCLSPLTKAVELFGDNFMAGFTLRDTPGFDEWQFFQREELRSDLAGALERLIYKYSVDGKFASAIQYSRRWLEMDQINESAHLILMRLYAWSDQRTAALRQYGECQRILKEELDVSPCEDITNLHQMIKRKGLLPSPESCFPMAISTKTPSRRNNLPIQITPFVGRETALVEVAERLQDPTCRLLTIIGSGGIGKTRLAIEVGFAQLENYLDGVYFVSLSLLDSPEIIIPTIAEAVGFSSFTTAGADSHEQSQQSMFGRQQLLNFLEQKSMLIILDNFEHLLDGVELVIDILKTAPEVDILVTSRVRLNVQGEHIYPVAGMNYPEEELEIKAEMLPKELEKYSALKLFLQQAQQANPNFELTTDNVPHILQICRSVEGIPLGILLATGWLKVLSPEEIAAEIDHSIDFLETDLSDTPDRQRSMRIVFDHSWRLLTEREREVFRKLSVFRGGFTREAAEQVTNTSLGNLRSLVDKSFLQRHPSGRYKIQELLQQFALEKLEGLPDEERNVKNLHCTYYAGYLQQRYERLVGKEWKETSAEIETEIGNVRAGWKWAANQIRLDDINNALETLATFYRIRSWYHEGEEAFAKVVKQLEEGDTLAPQKSKLVLGKALSMQGWMCFFLDITKAENLLVKSLAILRDLGAGKELAHTLRILGSTQLTWMEANPYYEEAITIYKECGDQYGSAAVLYNLGINNIAQGDYLKAKQLFEEGLSICREIADLEGIPYYINALGFIAWILGNYEEAKEIHQESLAFHTDISISYIIALSTVGLARCAAGLKDYKEAKRLFTDCLIMSKEIGATKAIADNLIDLGELAIVMGDYHDAVHFAQESLVFYNKVVEQERSPILSLSFRVLGEAAFGLKQYHRARKYLYLALDSAILGHWKDEILLSLVGIAQLMAFEGEEELSIELLNLVVHHPASWQWTKDKASRILTEIEFELPDEITAAAKKRGLVRDLGKTAEELLSTLETR